MKKDIEWLKAEIENMEYTTIKRAYMDDYISISKKGVLESINQLDEPEVLSQEWIDENKKDSGVHYIGYYVPVGRLHDLLVPKQELPVIPKYVAELLRKNKKDNFKLIDTYGIALERGSWVDRKLVDWLQEDWTREDIFARAWLDGFIIANEGEAYMNCYAEELNDGIIKQGDAQPLPLYIVEWLDNNINCMDKWKLASSLISTNKYKADQRIYRWTLEPENMDKFLNALSNGYIVEKEDIDWLKDKIFEKAWEEYDSAYLISLESLYEILDQVDCLKSKN